MASTVPAKSNNPLHNFDLPHLKWKKNHHSNNNNHTRRRSTSSPSRHDSPQRQSPVRESHAPARHSPTRQFSPMRDSHAAARHSPMRDSLPARVSPMRDSSMPFRQSSMRDSHAPARKSPMRESLPARVSPTRDPVAAVRVSQTHCESSEKERSSVIEYRRHSRISSAPESSKSDTSKKHNKVVEIEGRSSSKILLKIPRKNKTEEIAIHEEQQKENNNESQAQADEEATKTWNLRPRKPIHKSLNLNSGPFRSSGSAIQESKSQSNHVNVVNKEKENNESNAVTKKEKRLRFSVGLSREEIEEDIYAMTGSKAARRPKKRVKAVQKQLDILFPGLWLASITPDSYKVCENLPKG
ncbi:uncharacterized protein LOC132053610 [Lycium ferocissimum]|uniref:uncharacterized protein LOC132053610 n=1 Tax=Lycium ferocissimum TaxID=112874 RepID=UPI0028158688|nr:uncharacterized protein LOC132053610 [Lycium ferocissimum]